MCSVNNQLIISLAHLTKSYDSYMLKTEYLDIWTHPFFFLLSLASGRVPVMHTGVVKALCSIFFSECPNGYVQTVLCSEGDTFNMFKRSIFRRSYVHNVLCSESPMSRWSYVQKVLCPEGHMFRRSYVLKVICLEGHMFRRFLFGRFYVQ